MVSNEAFSHKIDYITIFEEILNLKGHQNSINGSRVTAIWQNGWIFPIGQSAEASRWRVSYQRGLSRLVFRLIECSVLPLTVYCTRRQSPLCRLSSSSQVFLKGSF